MKTVTLSSGQRVNLLYVLTRYKNEIRRRVNSRYDAEHASEHVKDIEALIELIK